MATLGLSSTGFLIPTLDEIRTDIFTDLVNAFGSSIDQVNGILARFVSILSERYSLLWEQLEVVYNSGNPDTASGLALKALCLLTGTLALEATFSTVTLTLTGTPAQVVPAAQQVSTRSNNGVNKFLTAASGTIAAVPAYAASVVTAIGARVTNGGRVYQALSAGTTSGTGPAAFVFGGTEVGADTIVWLYLGDGTGAIDVLGQSVLKGPIIGAAHDITQIDQPVGGWAGVCNVLDATVGFDDQTDESIRITREEELAQAGASTADAIRAGILSVPGVIPGSVVVFVNNTDSIDSNGLSPHSVELLVRGGADADVAAALLAQVGTGIQTLGTTSVVVVDSQGFSQTIRFVRPTAINIGVKITLTKIANVANDPSTYPVDGDTQVKAAIVAFGNSKRAGTDAVSSALAAQAFKVAGLIDVTACLISSTPAPGTPATPTTSTTIPISLLQLAVYDTSFITVISSNATP